MRLHVTGAKGMLGQAVIAEAQRQGHEVYADTYDIAFIDKLHGDTLVNCAGVVKQRDCLPSEFIRTNSLGPHLLAEMCDKYNARLVHISTDCVFAGYGPHDENATPDASDIYAVSKRAGEIDAKPHLTVRTSFVGRGSRGLIADLEKGKIVSASNRLLWSGHIVSTVAKTIITLCERQDIFGVLHIPGEFQSRLQLVQSLVRSLGLGTIIDEDNSFAADRRLVSSRWEWLGLPILPSFAVQLEQLKHE